MINDLASLKPRQNINQHLDTSEIINRAHAKEGMEVLSKIQTGDLLQGQVVLDCEQVMLKLSSGLKLLASLPTNVELNKELDFLVVGKTCQHLVLELAQTPKDEKNMTSIVDQAIHDLGIKDTSEMRQVIEQFVAKQLPLVKKQLMQLLHFSKNYDIPREALTNLVSQKQVPQQDDLELLTTLKKQGTKAFMPIFDDLIKTLSPKQSNELVRAFFELLNPHEVKEILLQQIPLLQDEEGVTRNEYSKGIDRSLITDEGVLKQTILSETEEGKWQYTFNKLFDEVLQYWSHDQLNKLSKALIHESLMVHLKSIENDEESEIEKITKLDIRLKQIVKAIREVTKENNEKTYVKPLESTIEVLEKYKMHGQYICFPLQLKEHHTMGELYFFKPKKWKTGQVQGLYVVLALNMPALNKVEVHLAEKSGQVNLKIKVENEIIKKQLMEYENVFLETMKSSKVPIEKIVFELFDEKKQKSDNHISPMLCHLDFKV